MSDQRNANKIHLSKRRLKELREMIQGNIKPACEIQPILTKKKKKSYSKANKTNKKVNKPAGISCLLSVLIWYNDY